MRPNRRLPRDWIVAALALVIAGAAGCVIRKGPVYLNRQADFGAVRRVALLPFDNYTNDTHAAEKVRQITSIELHRARAFDVVDGGEVFTALSEARVEKLTTMSKDQIRIAGERLEAQALLFGTVQEMGTDRAGSVSAPMVTLHFKMVDTATGETVWSAVVSRKGVGVGARLFGIGGESPNTAIQKLVREALDTLFR